MQNYLTHSRRFLSYLNSRGIDISLPARMEKLIAERREVDEKWDDKDIPGLIDELTDELNVVISMLDMLGVPDPLYAGARKLKATREKYEREGIRANANQDSHPAQLQDLRRGSPETCRDEAEGVRKKGNV